MNQLVARLLRLDGGVFAERFESLQQQPDCTSTGIRAVEKRRLPAVVGLPSRLDNVAIDVLRIGAGGPGLLNSTYVYVTCRVWGGSVG
ncbi:MAG TPA: hypothetical protein VNY82_08315 [Steroidobacteraceae bacterium]|nr:hypothetical protein [Steroidobacteraceae bacterium]